MGAAWLWWFFIQMLGLVCLPLTFSVFANLPDRGWALAKSLGVLCFCFLVWFPLALPAGLSSALGGLSLPYTQGVILVFLCIFVALNGFLLRYRWRQIAQFARRQAGYIALSEALFAGAFALLIWLRSFTPEIYGTEKPMDEAFISAIMRSPHLPPNDPWLSGYSINYYYLGHFIVATIAKLLGTSPAVAFNTAVALVFALMAVNLFGVTSNVAALLRRYHHRQVGERTRMDLLAAAPFGLAAVVFSLIFGNLAGASQWLAQIGAPLSFNIGFANILILAATLLCLYSLLWSLSPLIPAWRKPGDTMTQRRVVIAVTLGLSLIVLLPVVVVAFRGMGGWLGAAWPRITNWLGHPKLWTSYNWWNPSRALRSSPTDYQNITEFPAFSFVLSDLHAHVLALPFTVLAIGLALNLLLGRGKGLDVFGATNGWRALNLICGAVILGGLFMLNGWDLPTFAGLALLCLAAQQWRAHGRQLTKALALDFCTMGVFWLVLGVLLYLPFIRSFVSPSQGIGLVPAPALESSGQLVSRPIIFSDRSSVADFWSIFGVFLTVIGAFLLWQAVLAFVTRWRRAAAARQADSAALGPLDAVLPLGMLALLALAVAFVLLAFVPYSHVLVICLLGVIACAPLAYRRLNQPALAFTLILAGTGLALIAVCEVVYLRDVFDHGELYRMNTVFKLYYQTWTLFSIACGALLYELLDKGWRVAGEQSAAFKRLKEQQAAPWLSGTLATAGTATSGALPEAQTHLYEAEDVVPAGALAEQAAQSNAQASASIHDAEAAPQQQQEDEAGPSYSRDAPDAEQSLSEDESDEEVSAALPAPSRGRCAAPAALTPGLRALGLSGKLVWMACLLVLVLGALVYPLFAPTARTGNYAQHNGLDGMQYLARLYPGDAAAIRWINAHVTGDPVIVEATGGEYTDFGMVSTFTGLPTVLGWGGHEYQWRVNWLNDPTNASDFNRRSGDIDTIYTSTDTATVMQLLHQYHARYLYVGALEYQKYQGKADLGRFAQFLQVVYQAGGVTIYEVS